MKSENNKTSFDLFECKFFSQRSSSGIKKTLKKLRKKTNRFFAKKQIRDALND